MTEVSASNITAIGREQAANIPFIATKFEVFQEPAIRERMGSEMLDFVKQVHETNPDSLVFLDKSGRPASWFFRYLWQELYPGEKRPRIHYVNIGSEKEFASDEDRLYGAMGFPVPIDHDVVTDERLLVPLKKAFSISNTDKYYFDDKNIWIVDEHSSSGASLEGAQALFHEAFGDKIKSIEGKAIFSHGDMPWYKLTDYSGGRENMIGVSSSHWSDMLTTPIRPIPERVLVLRSELRLLARQTADSLRPPLAA